ncbi:ComEC/Rec2 family competence protein [Pseudalkalibacillus sp. A8]|uniref:ComEC/Rec2 family competence protein n=1 Tax=Pseudalkalibacillus sp. A8 TaxID=3382641 RepID=UPI0038B48018
MYIRPIMIFSLFLVLVLATNNPVKDEPVFFMDGEMKGNAVKNIDLNLKKDDIAISFLELESGEATLIQDSEGRNVLIDTGSEQSAEEFKQQMRVFHVDQIDTLILTNKGEQFTGNLEWLTDEFDISKVFVAQNVVNDLTERIQVPDGTVKPLETGNQFKLLDKISVKVKYLEKHKENEIGGMALDFQYGIKHFLFMGVANESAEKAIIQDGSLNASLIKIGGFGHYFGTSEELLDHINPEVAVIFKRSGYRASDEVMFRLEDRWTEIFKPYEQGIVMVKTNQKEYEITQIPLFRPKLAYK